MCPVKWVSAFWIILLPASPCLPLKWKQEVLCECLLHVRTGVPGGIVVKALRYKLAGHGFNSRWCHWNFSVTILLVTLWPWGQLSLWQKWVPGTFPGDKCNRCVSLTTLPPSCAVVIKSGNVNFLEPSGLLQACNRTALALPYTSEPVYHIPNFSHHTNLV
jgi:hypothetical protein